MRRRPLAVLLATVLTLLVGGSLRAQPAADRASEVDAALAVARREGVCGAEAGLVERSRAAHARLGERSTAAFVAAAGARLLGCVADLPAARERSILAGGAPIGATMAPRPRVEVGAVRALSEQDAIDVGMIEHLARSRATPAASCVSVLALPRGTRGEIVLSLTYGATGEVTSWSVLSNSTGSDALAGCALDVLQPVRVAPAPARPATFTIELRYVDWR